MQEACQHGTLASSVLDLALEEVSDLLGRLVLVLVDEVL
uniref:Uncharacterized protein n=1 Tax=Steinernema glaseri TaxID=37863 RepID=A0A1I8AT42_9BILA